MKAALLTVGDELLIGQVVNTNASWLGEQLSLAGVEVIRSVTLPDDEAALGAALCQATEEVDLVIVTGGLGPTHDDVTREAVAAHAGVELQLDQTVLDSIRYRFARRGREMPERNTLQALVPQGFEVLPNPVGTAPGLWRSRFESGRRSILAVLPGVPHEMRYLTQHEILPRIVGEAGPRVIRHRTLLTAGIGESHLQELIGDVSGFLTSETRLAYLPGPGGVRLRLSVIGDDVDSVERALSRFEAHLRERIDRFIYGTNGDSMEAVVGRMLMERHMRLAVAESCTGGTLLHRVTNVAGASNYLVGGVVAYGNQVKTEILGVSAELLAREGAVSEAVARQMAIGVRRLLRADIGVSATGIAGPSGGTSEKPVGTVWMACADECGEDAMLMQFSYDRELNKELASTAALDMVRKRLSEPGPG